MAGTLMYHRLAWLAFLSFSLQAAHLVYRTSTSGTLVAADSSGNAFVVGNQGIVKLDPDGNVIYSKPLPSILDQSSAMAVDSAGNVVLAGNTNSDSLPTTPGVFQPKRSPGVCIT